MSSELEIPGYLSRIPNQVYARLEPEHTETESVLVLWRFREPSPQQIGDYIAAKATAIDGMMPSLKSGLVDTSQFTSTEKLLLGFGSEGRSLIAQDKMVQDLIKGYAPTNASLDNDISLQLVTGTVPLPLDEHSRDDPKRDLDWYMSNTQSVGSLTISIASGELPPFEEMKVLIKHMTFHSAILRTRESRYSTAETLDLVRTLYTALPSRSEIEMIPDLSADMLEKESAIALYNFMRHQVLITLSGAELGQTTSHQQDKRKKTVFN